jgi:ADP-ribose pyrophosphatase
MHRKAGLLMKWDVIASRLSYSDKYIHLRTDHCRKEDGTEIPTFHVLEYGTWVNAVVITQDHQCVLVNEYRHGVADVRLGLPGGGMEPAESDPLVAVKREVAEETGYTSDTWFPLCCLDVNSSTHNNVLHSFIAIDAVQSESQNLDPTEDLEIDRMHFAELLNSLKHNEIQVQALHAAPIWHATSWIIASKIDSLKPLQESLVRQFIHIQ